MIAHDGRWAVEEERKKNRYFIYFMRRVWPVSQVVEGKNAARDLRANPTCVHDANIRPGLIFATPALQVYLGIYLPRQRESIQVYTHTHTHAYLDLLSPSPPTLTPAGKNPCTHTRPRRRPPRSGRPWCAAGSRTRRCAAGRPWRGPTGTCRRRRARR